MHQDTRDHADGHSVETKDSLAVGSGVKVGDKQHVSEGPISTILNAPQTLSRSDTRHKLRFKRSGTRGPAGTGVQRAAKLLRVRSPEPLTFICFQRLTRHLLAEPRLHAGGRPQVQHGPGGVGHGLSGRLQCGVLNLHLHLGGHVHALLVHGAVIYRAGLLVLPELLGKLKSSKNGQQSAASAAVKHRGRGAIYSVTVFILNCFTLKSRRQCS